MKQIYKNLYQNILEMFLQKEYVMLSLWKILNSKKLKIYYLVIIFNYLIIDQKEIII